MRAHRRVAYAAGAAAIKSMIGYQSGFLLFVNSKQHLLTLQQNDSAVRMRNGIQCAMLNGRTVCTVQRGANHLIHPTELELEQAGMPIEKIHNRNPTLQARIRDVRERK